MKPYWIKTNFIIKKIFSGHTWHFPLSKNKIYLTFDDGPTPQVTEWVLEQLKKYDAKATFFCIGKNIEENPSVFKKLLEQGHSIGNHTHTHPNGWKTTTNDYLENVELCQKTLAANNVSTRLFRPPYGKLKPLQFNSLKKKGFKIIMWDILSADFDATIEPEECLKNVVQNIKQGSIIIFHDSKKAFKNLEYSLPQVLEYAKNKNLRCEIISNSTI